MRLFTDICILFYLNWEHENKLTQRIIDRYINGDKTSGHVDDKANKLHAIASLRVLLDATKEQTVANGRDPNEEVNGTSLILPKI